MADNLHSFAKLEQSLKKQIFEEGYKGTIPIEWRQGRTAYGGIIAGLALASVIAEESTLPPLRSANINFIGPVSENPTFKNILLRRGRNVISIESKVYIKKEIVAHIVFIFGAHRTSDLNIAYPAKDHPAPDECENYIPQEAAQFIPPFLDNFDVKLISGSRPITGANKGYIRTWARHKDPASRHGMTSLLTLSDVLPPAAMPLLTKMSPVSSVNFMLNILDDNPQSKDGWWDIETQLTAASGGYSSQTMRIWNQEGTLVAEGIQCVAIF